MVALTRKRDVKELIMLSLHKISYSFFIYSIIESYTILSKNIIESSIENENITIQNIRGADLWPINFRLVFLYALRVYQYLNIYALDY